MPLVEVNDLASVGMIADQAPYMLPPEAWSLARNMRYEGGRVVKLKGQSQVFGTPGVAPHFALAISSAAQTWWLYTSLAKGYVYDGNSHTDITPTAGDFAAAQTRDWNGTIIGGIPIINNGIDVPHQWASYATATKFTTLTNWIAGQKAKVIRALGPTLIAANINKSGTLYPHLVKTSHPADPGSVPSSWDETDATKDTTENDLPDVESGIIMTMQSLRGAMYIYKEGSIWRMRFIGGRFVYAFDTFLETVGVIAPRGVAVLGDGMRHVVWGQDDIILHNGQGAESILDKRWKRTLFADIDTVSYLNCFAFTNPAFDEVWFCYPEMGQTQPTKALIWNYRESQFGVFSIAEVNFRNVAVGVVETASAGAWDSDSEVWDTDSEPWSTAERRKVVLCGTDATKFYRLDAGETRDGVAFTPTLQRTGLAILGRKSNGTPIVDFIQRKLCNRIWIKAEGGPIRVRLGTQDIVRGNVTWAAYQDFNPQTQVYLDFILSGRALAVEFTSDGTEPWKLEGYKLDVTPAGNF